MKSSLIFVFVTVLATVAHAGSPVDKVIQLLKALSDKVVKEDEDAQKVFVKFSAWCDVRSTDLEFDIKTGKAEVAELSAIIEKEIAKSTAFRTQIEELAGSLAKDEADLKAASDIRGKEAGNFAADEKESSEVIGALERAIALLSREVAKGVETGIMLQIKHTKNIAQVLSVMVHASALSSADAKTLTSFVQNTQESESGDEDEDEGMHQMMGAPKAAAYKVDRDGIINMMENLLGKAQTQLQTARTTETANRHNYDLLKQSLGGEISADQKDMAEVKKNLAASQETKATAEGDLAVTSADLKEDEATFGSLAQDCKMGRLDHEADAKSRAEELKILAMAKKILVDDNDTYSAVVGHTYGDAAVDQAYTFFQVARSDLISSADLAKFEAVRFIQDLARKEQSAALAQLASKMSSIIRFGASAGADPMAKVKKLLDDMIANLEKDAAAEATQQAFCEKETSDSNAKKEENQADLDKLATSIDSMSAKAAELKEESATLQMELGQLARSQAEMDKIRVDEKALFSNNKQEMQAGITGLQQAVSVLREYYATDDSNRAEAGAGGHAAGRSGHNSGAGAIISELQNVESDFTKTLADMETSESTAAREYKESVQVNTVSKATKENDLKYKAKEAAGLGKSLVQARSDKEGVQSELDAVLEYLSKLEQQCVGKASTFADRKARRDAEILGLKQGLALLEGESALIQRSSKRSFRGKHPGVQHSNL